MAVYCVTKNANAFFTDWKNFVENIDLVYVLFVDWPITRFKDGWICVLFFSKYFVLIEDFWNDRTNLISFGHDKGDFNDFFKRRLIAFYHRYVSFIIFCFLNKFKGYFLEMRDSSRFKIYCYSLGNS